MNNFSAENEFTVKFHNYKHKNTITSDLLSHFKNILLNRQSDAKNKLATPTLHHRHINESKLNHNTHISRCLTIISLMIVIFYDLWHHLGTLQSLLHIYIYPYFNIITFTCHVKIMYFYNIQYTLMTHIEHHNNTHMTLYVHTCGCHKFIKSARFMRIQPRKTKAEKKRSHFENYIKNTCVSNTFYISSYTFLLMMLNDVIFSIRFEIHVAIAIQDEEKPKQQKSHNTLEK